MNIIVKRKTKAFTLIELLGVIVILGVLAAIATPIILGVIGNAQREAFKNTAYGVSKSANNTYVSNLYKGREATNVVFTYTDGVETSTPDGFILNYSGTKPQNGQVVLTKTGKVAIALHNGKYCATKGYSDSAVTIEEKALGDCVLTEEIPAEEELTGTGTVDDPYVIMTEQQLYNIRNNMSAYYVLGRNITLSNYQTGTGFTPIGNSDTPFTGNINGNGHKIINLFINNPSDNIGLFGYTSGATIKNITLESLSVTGNSCTGSLIGRTTNSSAIEGIIASGDIVGTSNTGGLVGCLNVSTVTSSYAAVNTVGSGNVIGGLIGLVETSNNVTINKTLASGNVTSTADYVGGLIGQLGTGSGSTVTLTNSYAIGHVQGRNYVGGLIGYSRYAGITNTYAVGLITATSGSGGLVARSNNTTATNSYWSTDTTKVATSIIGTSSSVSSMLSKTTSYSDWDFINVWDIIEGTTLAYLRGMPIPDGIYEDELDYTDYGAGGGSGTQADPYIIVNEAQLYAVRNNLSAYYKLGKDITMTSYQVGTGFDPIGTSATPFTGNFDGNGFKINNLYINSTANNVGLFGYASGNAVIKNLTLTNVNVKGAASTGALVGFITGTNALVQYVRVSGLVTATGHYSGMIAGQVQYSQIKNNYVTGTINGTWYVGGLVGNTVYTNAKLLLNYSSVNVTGTNYVGGLVGNLSESEIRQCVSTGTVNGSSDVGGLLGYLTGYSSTQGKVIDSYSTGSVIGSSDVGGLVGYGSYGNIITSYTISSVSGSSDVGGMGGKVGSGQFSATNSYWSPETAVVLNSYNGISTFIDKMFSRNNCYVSWNFTDVWDIEEGSTLAYLRGLPIPDDIYEEELDYVDFTGSSGSGTQADPYVLVSASQVSAIRYVPTAYYKLGNDIDMSSYGTGTGFEPIANFYGQLDGDGHKISNLYINRPAAGNVGLIGTFTSVTSSQVPHIKNLTLDNVNITGGGNTGALVGLSNARYDATDTKITNVIVTGTITGTSATGGLVGDSAGTTITNSYVNATITGTNYVGGFIGRAGAKENISKSIASVNVTATGGYGGGFIGYGSGGSSPSLITIANSFSTGSIQSASYGAGIAGYARYNVISYSYTLCDVHTSTNASAIIASDGNYNTVSYTYWSPESSKISTAGYGINTLFSGLLNSGAYSGWNFTDIWNIQSGSTTAYLRGMTIPDSVNASNYSYVSYPSGSGTVGDPYIITNETQINGMRYGLGSYYQLGANVTMTSYQTGTGFDPVGNSSTKFTGGLDGNGYKISNLYINRASTNIGLFGYTNGATIKNLTLENVNITNTIPSGNYSTGSLVGRSDSATSVRNSYVSGSITISGACVSDVYTGGLIGYAYYSTVVEKVVSTVNVATNCSNTGGLIGQATGGAAATKVIVLNSYSLGNVQGRTVVGGLIGNTTYAEITNSYAMGTVSGTVTTYVGGLVGLNNGNSTAPNSYWSMEGSGATTSALGTNINISVLLRSSNYNSWDFVNTWDIVDGTTLAYLRGMPVPDKVYASNYTYVAYTSGSGTQADPLIINNDTQLNGMRYYLGGNYKLGNNITMTSYQTGTGFAPIGSFVGTLDGDGHKITNLYINLTTGTVGLFGYTTAATIKNLTLENVNITGGSQTGSVAGVLKNGLIENVIVTGTVRGGDTVGGLVGQLGHASGGTISKSYTNVTITATGNFSGGIAGQIYGNTAPLPTIINSYALGSVSGPGYNGGLVGKSTTGTITNCYSTGTVTGTTSPGGLVGTQQTSSTASNSFWDTTTSTKATSALGTGKATALMYQQATFTSWDFSTIWTINEGTGYPTLR